ncbi:3',5'-cyclic AMP phosphodiesterase CpdA [Microbacterium terrae]|uniref:3',5'-cyclic adenosine monophosphate phosphodiesterase CpdA n=1 Tax=Microbacterium terrae TaxID=69369 RepID=A0A0M2H475_9MICO|nr:phosphodiesterase [Microbacterium terrae]KJL39221.1 3',5'-cyclic adenosine monophosphate phosphodiesterase CpdA [Microbacterium terrae]MBP1076845.1 3',5'-cyclic AMP phosphodiesterase CpdA [Microbacterium terrae]GLJ99440.1 3',5'-cyclic adenosine monophosphate phosphodiesterase CpdA [Microbacterium terrae]
MRTAEYPAPDRILLHISDTHLRADGTRIFDVVDGAERLERAISAIEASGARPHAIVFTGDLADHGEPGAYATLRTMVEPFAARLGARILWVMGNHDDRAAFRAGLYDDLSADMRPIDRVDELDGLRIVTLDSTVPGEHHGELRDEQLAWLADVLATPAPLGTVLAMHHPPVPAVLPLAASVELRDQSRLARVLRGTDVRTIIAGHLHYSTFATFAGIPVSVASSTCYAQDLTVPVGGTRPQDGAQAFNLVHVYDDTVVHSIVPVEAPRVMEYIDPVEAQRRLRAAGIAPVSASRTDAPTEPIALVR